MVEAMEKDIDISLKNLHTDYIDLYQIHNPSAKELEQVMHFAIRQVDLGTGTVSCEIGLPEKLFYEILSSKAGLSIENDAQLLQLLMELAT